MLWTFLRNGDDLVKNVLLWMLTKECITLEVKENVLIWRLTKECITLKVKEAGQKIRPRKTWKGVVASRYLCDHFQRVTSYNRRRVRSSSSSPLLI